MEFKDRLKDLRIKNGLTQGELASKLFISRQSLSHYELGYSLPNRMVLNSMALYLNVSLKYLLNGHD